MRIHKSITAKRVMARLEEAQQTLDDPGFCVSCGTEAEGVEPDAQRYECEACGAPAVYGAEQLLFHLVA